jgi:hypothetical protein
MSKWLLCLENIDDPSTPIGIFSSLENASKHHNGLGLKDWKYNKADKQWFCIKPGCNFTITEVPEYN